MVELLSMREVTKVFSSFNVNSFVILNDLDQLFPPADDYTTACRILHLRFQYHSEGRRQELDAKLAL